MTIAEVAPLLSRTDATVASLANRHEIGAYKVAGRWLIARIDLHGFAASNPRATKSDLRLVLDPAPEFTGDVGGALSHLSPHLPRRLAAEILRVSGASLLHLGLEADFEGRVDRAALVEILPSASNFGPHYSAASE